MNIFEYLEYFFDTLDSNKALIARGERGWDYHKLTERAR
jgi:hypothetical protein